MSANDMNNLMGRENERMNGNWITVRKPKLNRRAKLSPRSIELCNLEGGCLHPTKLVWAFAAFLGERSLLLQGERSSVFQASGLVGKESFQIPWAPHGSRNQLQSRS